MKDRAMQALYKLALDPVAETTADPNSYGFRPYRGCADAIGQCFISLAKRYSPVWILEGDIKACFDEISHQWMLENIPMDKQTLQKWLKAGYVEGGKLYRVLSASLHRANFFIFFGWPEDARWRAPLSGVFCRSDYL